jgi:hypothetical protein
MITNHKKRFGNLIILREDFMTKGFGYIFGKIVFLSVICAAFTASKCPPCDLTNDKIDSAHVVFTSITVPPGGGTQRYLEVIASGFHPNAKATISIPQLPTISGGHESFSAPVTFDAQGKLDWKKTDIPLLIGGFGNPNLDIAISVAEEGGGCFASTMIKESEFFQK